MAADLFTQLFNDNGNIAQWSRGNPYLHLLGRYLHAYLPLNAPCSPAARDPPDHNVVFLQLAIDYWIDTALVVKYEFGRVESHKEEYLTHTHTSFL
jgi:hypothetical protein